MKRMFIVSIVAVVIASCSKEQRRAHHVEEVPTVEVVPVRSMQPSMNVVLPGELKPWNRTLLHAKVRGYVGNVLVDRGTVVQKGQLLATLEAPEIVAALNHAMAQLASAEASLIEQRTKKDISTSTYKRILETSKTAGAVSANELEVAHARMMSDSALSRAGEENLRAAKAQVASQEQLVQYLSVRAPFDGNITERNVSPGDLVGPDIDAKPMFILEDQSKLRLTIAVPENLSNAVQDNSMVSFTIEADPLKEYRAKFARSSNSLQEHNRTMLAEYDFVNTHGDLKAGMYAEVQMPIKRRRPTMFVPRSSVLTSTEGVFVLKVNENVTEWVSVHKGNSADSLIEVFGHVAVGDRVVRNANEELRHGQSVKWK